MYAKGTNMSSLRYTDTMQPNPMYRGDAAQSAASVSAPNPFSQAPAAQSQPASKRPNPFAQSPAAQPNQQAAPTSRAIDMSAYRPGVAQPIAPQSQGTPYQPYVNNQGQQFTGTMSFAPGTSDAYRNHGPGAFGSWANSRGYYNQPSQVTGDPRGALAAASPADRPPPFQMGLASTPWGASADPFVERDALIQRLAAQRMQNQIAFNSGGPVNPVAGMLPWNNVPQAMQEAGLAGGAPSMRPGYGGGFVGAANGGFGQDAGYTAPPGPVPGYGTPPNLRGAGRTADFQDRDMDGVDDRDQDGPGMPRYGGQGTGGGMSAADRLRAKHPNWDSYPEWYKQQEYKQDAWEQSGQGGVGKDNTAGQSSPPPSNYVPYKYAPDRPYPRPIALTSPDFQYGRPVATQPKYNSPRENPSIVGNNVAAANRNWRENNPGAPHYYNTPKGKKEWSRLTQGQKMGLV